MHKTSLCLSNFKGCDNFLQLHRPLDSQKKKNIKGRDRSRQKGLAMIKKKNCNFPKFYSADIQGTFV